MRFAKEILKQMGQDINALLRGYGAITAYIVATITIIILTVMLLLNVIEPADTPSGRGLQALAISAILITEGGLAPWIWFSGKKARAKITKENKELLDSIKGKR